MIRCSIVWRAIVLFLQIAISCTAFVVKTPWPVSHNVLIDKTKLKFSQTEEQQSETNTAHQKEELRTLYPALEANANGTIAVDDMHTIFYQEYGQNATNALTALFLHGGPGAGCNANHARFFDPAKYRIVLLDQRGCGLSTPRGQTERNTLQYLVDDCEALRIELGIEKWDVILGGSWGTTLAIAYAQTYPSNVGSIVLRGVCLLRLSEVDWLFSSNGGAASLDPEGWNNFSAAVGINHEENDDDNDRAALHGHYDRLLGDDPIARINAARSWMMWEMRISSLAKRNETDDDKNATQPPVLVWTPGQGWSCQDSQGNKLHNTTWYASHALRRGLSLENDHGEEVTTVREVSPVSAPPPPVQSSGNQTISKEDAAKFIPAQAMLTCFYSVNGRYVTDNVNLLAQERMVRIRNIPCIAVQGGNDTICPPDTALDLHEAWPEMELRIPSGAGHSMYDPVITNELVRATDRLAKL